MSRSDAAIRRCRPGFVDSGRFQCHDGSDQPRAIEDREDRLIVRYAITASDSSLSTIRRVTFTRVSTMTIPRRRLIEQNLCSYRPLLPLPLLTAHCRARLQWFLARSARSPDISPIEDVWNMMGRRMKSIQQMEQIWQEIPQKTVRVLYYSMSRRVAACIQARGGLTPY
ncbi:HTH_Tnp_Tc3_2 domain-containing protein [Trichonephila clavipes]|nr:HTH_Tnp_Tc3_2 domain-containing protein [Trichonephila clavipes]